MLRRRFESQLGKRHCRCAQETTHHAHKFFVLSNSRTLPYDHQPTLHSGNMATLLMVSLPHLLTLPHLLYMHQERSSMRGQQKAGVESVEQLLLLAVELLLNSEPWHDILCCTLSTLCTFR